MSPTSIIIDNVLDPDSVVRIKESIDESTKDPFFYAMNSNHLYDNFCLAMINVASEFYDLSSSVGYEFWTRLNRCAAGWHRDKDERLYDEQKNQIEQDMSPFGFISDGLEDDSFVDAEGDRWKVDEYGDRSFMWEYN